MTTENRIIAEQAIEIRKLKDKVDDLEWKIKNLHSSVEMYREKEIKYNNRIEELEESQLKKDIEEISAVHVKLISKNSQLTSEIESQRKEFDSTTEALFEAMNSIKKLECELQIAKSAYNGAMDSLKKCRKENNS